MNVQALFRCATLLFLVARSATAAPVIDPVGNVTVPAGKSLIIPVTATSPNGRPLTFTATSSTNRITVEVHTNNPFWKMSVVQAAPANAPGAFQTPYRGGIVTVTNIGDLTFMLFRDLAPHSVDVIQGFTMGGFYNSNTIFHRVVPGFVIQGGDPSTNGTGGPVFRYDDEFNPSAIFSGNGQLALANSGKDTDGSQFFVTAGPQRALDFGYTIFGQLLRGFEVLTNVINTPTNGASRPLADVIITKASLVPDNFDTVLTLTGTNLAGISGTIKIIADDEAGGRATNSFTATTLADTGSNHQPFILQDTGTNLITFSSQKITNTVSALDLEGDAMYWFPGFADSNSALNATNSSYSYNTNTGVIQIFVVANAGYTGAISFIVVASPNPNWSRFAASLFPASYPYDQQKYTFVFGDTPIVAQPTNFTAFPLTSFTNRLMATFTNGVSNSDMTNFTAFINWGDNSTNSGIILTNADGFKEVRGAHIYTNAGNYPVYLTIQSYLGASATVAASASVRPSVGLTVAGADSIVAWPAWATDYQLQSTTNLVAVNWQVVSNWPVLNGYDSLVTNSPPDGILFFRLKK